MERSLISDVVVRLLLDGFWGCWRGLFINRLKCERITGNLEAGGAATGVYQQWLSAQCMLWGDLIVAFLLI